MLKILLLEAPDSLGKTTIKNEILKLTNDFIVVERFAASQWVYNGIFYDNKGNTKIDECLFLDNLIKNYAYYIYFVANRNDIVKRMKDKKEDMNKLKYLNKLLKRYDYYFSKTPIKVLKFNTSKMSPQDIAKEIIYKCK